MREGMILPFILLTATALGGYAAARHLSAAPAAPWLGLLVGLLLGFVVIFLEKKISKIPFAELLGGIAGLVVGLVIANLFTRVILADVFHSSPVVVSLFLLFHAVLGYLGLVMGSRKTRELDLKRFRLFSKMPAPKVNYKLLDTSVIIDGRIFDICETGFIEGTLVIPQFILQELMRIADSADPLRRARGKRGLDVLKKIQKQTDLDVIISDQDFPKIKEVDHKLVALASKMGGTVITNDVNLYEIAEIQGVPVLNINQLATALKPMVLPGENMNVYVQKEGKEPGQGIAYLDDGTMVVIKRGKKLIGKNADVAVTSVLQTTAGRMIFAERREDAAQQIQQLK